MSTPRDALLTQLVRRFPRADAERLATELSFLNVEPEFIEEVINAGDRLPLETPPPELSASLRSMFAKHLGVAPHFIDLTKIFDSRTSRELAGVRGVTDATEGWTLAFESEQADVAVDVTPRRGDVFDLEIQVLSRRPASAETSHAEVTLDEVATAADSLGRAVFSGIRAGVHRLTVFTDAIVLRTSLEL
ncbi:MAG: hypothetical protein GY925_14770 [Actinomycetia bacterium]|nr:hypothetical protein [Actinomycetes bacterium]